MSVMCPTGAADRHQMAVTLSLSVGDPGSLIIIDSYGRGVYRKS
jgi:hypothetical protein